MPNLEVLILSGSPIKTLEPLANCKKLRVLEISNCGYITDVSSLAGCESLEMLNISYTKVDSLAGLEELPLTHLVAVGGTGSRISQEDKDSFAESHPDCNTMYTGSQEFGVGWRYSDKETKMEWYEKSAEAFKYPHSPNKTGWYLD